MHRVALLAALALFTGCDSSPPQLIDETDGPRIVTLAPHLAEIVFAVGAGDRLVGVSAYSDFPAEVLELPLVGDAFTVDLEQLALLKPDILLAWESGMPASTVDDLRRSGYRVEVIRTRGLDDIESAMRHIGELANTVDAAESAADRFRGELSKLADRYSTGSRLSAFVQIAERPLYTVNGDHYISDILELCGADNVFDDLDTLAPGVDVEAVVARNPSVMVTSGDVTRLDNWRSFDSIDAVKHERFIALPADETGRPGPRAVIAAEAACRGLQAMRKAASS